MLWKPIPVGAPGRGEARPQGQTEQVLALLLTAPADHEAGPSPARPGGTGRALAGPCRGRLPGSLLSFLFLSCLFRKSLPSVPRKPELAVLEIIISTFRSVLCQPVRAASVKTIRNFAFDERFERVTLNGRF